MIYLLIGCAIFALLSLLPHGLARTERKGRAEPKD